MIRFLGGRWNSPLSFKNVNWNLKWVIEILFIIDIFGKTNAAQNNTTNIKDAGQYDFGIDPWATSNVPKDTFKTTSSNTGWPPSSNGDTMKQSNGTNNLFASSIMPASKSTNPFL